MSKLFVYGTLRGKMCYTHELLNFAMFMASGNFPYPIIYPAMKAVVKGNIRLIDDNDWSTLDYYEGVNNGLYRRTETSVRNLHTRELENVQIYLPADPKLYETRGQQIVTGDWLSRLTDEQRDLIH